MVSSTTRCSTKVRKAPANIFYTERSQSAGRFPGPIPDEARKAATFADGFCLGTDYVYPRTTNRILSAYLTAAGVSPDDLMTFIRRSANSEWQGSSRGSKPSVRREKRPRIMSP